MNPEKRVVANRDKRWIACSQEPVSKDHHVESRIEPRVLASPDQPADLVPPGRRKRDHSRRHHAGPPNLSAISSSSVVMKNAASGLSRFGPSSLFLYADLIRLLRPRRRIA